MSGRLRIDVRLAGDVADWVSQSMGPGDCFTSFSHACEVGLARVYTEDRWMRQACRKRGIPYDARAFWQSRPQVIQSKPPKGRPPRGAPARDTRRLIAVTPEELVRWAGDCGAFDSPSHAIEAGLRILQENQQEAAVAGAWFRFDGERLLVHLVRAL